MNKDYENYCDYQVTVAKLSGDEGYIAYIKQFSFCYAIGETTDEALKDLKTVLEIYMDHYKEKELELPEPTLYKEEFFINKL